MDGRQGQLEQDHDSEWPIVIDEAEIYVGEVVYSSKLIWVFGPLFAFPTFWEEYTPKQGLLEINISITALSGAEISFDLREITLTLEDGRSLSPVAYAKWGANFEPPAPVALSGDQNWKGRLQYDLSISTLGPFKLHIKPLNVNGQSVHLPPIPFVQAKSYSGS